MQRKRLIFLGSKPIGYECFAHLLSVRDELNIEVTSVLTNTRKEFGDGHDLNALAAEYGIPVIADLDQLPECDILYSVQYNKILKQQHIGKAQQVAVNLHMAPLPEYRGSNQFSFAIIDQKNEFGTTLHLIDSRIDHGDILFTERFAIPEGCWVNELYQLTFDATVHLFKQTLADVVAGNYKPTPQSDLVERYGTSIHYRNEINDLKCIDINWDKEKIDRYIRATSMPGFEPPYYLEDGKKNVFFGATSMSQKHIVLTVTSDANYDQRMIRICTSLHNAGYKVTLISRTFANSTPLIKKPYEQIRVKQSIGSGKMFYLTYNIKLLFILLFKKADVFCAIDLDTILAVYYASKLRGMPRVYDAHELFCDIEEVASRPKVQKMWQAIERHTVPHFKYGYTVNKSYVDEYRRMYGVEYAIVRNATILRPFSIPEKKERYILYQGAVNHGRCFEQLIPAMKQVDAKLIICGYGNFYKEAESIMIANGLQDKAIFKGYIPPDELPEYTKKAYIGITLFVATSLSNELSLANRFFDYMHHGVPQLAARYPEYENINNEYEVATLLDEITPDSIVAALNKLLTDSAYYERLQQNCMKAREVYCWQEEEKRLLKVYQDLFSQHGK